MADSGPGSDGPDPARAELRERRREIRLQKIEFQQELLRIVTLLAAFVGMNVMPLVVLLVVAGIRWWVTPVPVVTFEPVGIQLRGDGTKVTALANALVVVEVLRNALRIHLKGPPEIEVELPSHE